MCFSFADFSFFCLVAAVKEPARSAGRAASGRCAHAQERIAMHFEEVHELREQVADLQHRLAESEERLDFTERLLTRGRDEAASHG